MLGISYNQNRRALEKKITEDLLSESAQSARATGVWLKERLYDLRVFAGSDEVANTLDRPATGARGSAIATSQAEGRLRDYLLSLHERFSDFEQLMVVDLDGKVVASSGEISQIRLPRRLAGDAAFGNSDRRRRVLGCESGKGQAGGGRPCPTRRWTTHRSVRGGAESGAGQAPASRIRPRQHRGDFPGQQQGLSDRQLRGDDRGARQDADGASNDEEAAEECARAFHLHQLRGPRRHRNPRVRPAGELGRSYRRYPRSRPFSRSATSATSRCSSSLFCSFSWRRPAIVWAS